ncbi:aminodeoxychorismate synthase, component I [Edwardsiella hoshinae]|uniref:aminodeoxychorismate synthase n=1 Tax=Edwardsiella hoshinae TaxID=93378 RepID=A0ABN4SX07_9GAMM|nr:aminodeoxychorismate synthase component 1 [Edwardsiella hoshinae]AOV97030.1 aminodeoxychorismate synthase, component I [Edwardsiella hoshinae]
MTVTPELTQCYLPYRPDAALHYFTPLAHRPWAMLLSSGNAEHPHNRYDIIVAEPCATLETRGALTTLVDSAGSQIYRDDPFTLLRHELARCLPTCPPQPDLPFCGGALGLWGYDLGRRFETLPALAAADLQTPDMALGIYDWALIIDHQLRRITLLSWRDATQRLHWLQTLPSAATSAPFALTSNWQANLSQAAYRQAFQRVQAHLAAGDCYQINLTQRFAADYQGDEWQAFLRLTQANRAPFSAFLRLPQSAVLSVSPERFLRLERGEISTRPIKGTLPRRTDAQADEQQRQRLAASAKDRAENLMIVDLMRNDVGRVAAAGSVRVPELFAVESFPAVHHLVSTIRAHLAAGLDGCDLLRACFPGGSITGAPKIRAMTIIDALEPQRRNVYCGAIGYLSACGDMDTSITIRTLLAERGRLYCWAGGGIVADSEVEAEYQETLDKVSKILPLLAVSESL